MVIDAAYKANLDLPKKGAKGRGKKKAADDEKSFIDQEDDMMD